MGEVGDKLAAGVERYRKTLDNNAAQASDTAAQQREAAQSAGSAEGSPTPTPAVPGAPQAEAR